MKIVIRKKTRYLLRRVHHLPRRKKIIVIAFVTMFTILLKNCEVEDIIGLPLGFEIGNQKDGYLELQNRLRTLVEQDRGLGCVMPTLDPFAPEIVQFDETHPPPQCRGEDWVECRLSKCYVKPTVLARMADLACTYRDLMYADDENYYLGKPVEVAAGDAYNLNASDHVKVSCRGTPVDSLGVFASRWLGFKAGYRPVERPAQRPDAALNGFMLFIDSMSKNEFMRILPKSYNLLKYNLHAVVMDSTHGALMPILMGHNYLEVPDCRRMPSNTRRVDPNDLIFGLLEHYGYRTAFFEDRPDFNIFNYRFNGFERMPTHHTMRTLMRAYAHAEETSNLIKYDYKNQCFGSEMTLKFMMKYSAQMFKMRGKKFCVTFSSSHSHDPDRIYISHLDEDLANFLRSFKREGHLEDTLLFVMADHGLRIGDVVNTHQGKLEERLPFVSVVLPERLKRERPGALATLAANAGVLTTPYDIHATVLDALGLARHRNKHSVPGADLERGMSLLQPIPRGRSCAEAGVLPHWCACQQWWPVAENDAVYKKAARELARYVNQMTANIRNLCAKRNLVSIAWVKRKAVNSDNLETHSVLPSRAQFGRNDKTLDAPDFVYYQAKIVMEPGEAIYEATMLYDAREDSFRISHTDVARIDEYGNEPRCVANTHPHLNYYCYCV